LFPLWLVLRVLNARPDHDLLITSDRWNKSDIITCDWKHNGDGPLKDDLTRSKHVWKTVIMINMTY